MPAQNIRYSELFLYKKRTNSFKLCLPAHSLWDLRTFTLSFLISSAFEKVIWKISPCWFSVGSSEDYSGWRNTNVNGRKQYDYNSSALRHVTERLPTESLCFSFSLNTVFLSREVINFAFRITRLVYFLIWCMLIIGSLTLPSSM